MSTSTISAPGGHTQNPQPRRSKVSISQVIGELLLTVGVVLFLFAFYESYWTNIASGKANAAADAQMEEQWQNQRVNPRGQITPALGDAFARLYIPTFGSDFQFAVVEGTSDEDLNRGPGRYVDTQMPGEAGNFAIAGHRVGKGAPFNDLGNLQTCDAIVIETQTAWEVYRVLPIDAQGEARRAEALDCFTPEQTERMISGEYAGVNGRYITTPGDINTISAVPGTDIITADPGMEKMITLTTCHPQFSNAERMIVHGMLTDSIPKVGDGSRPAVLQEA
ncbi:class E sortase [Corynebacterium kozikiae]|uniref:class E sortase n=1 Tax=Corynebacterium kozikiae TaxID=2968469 RepID=UPI00211CA68B|nr:class E sortase [Corynebacterium sp. 76QC2CO]MCQ9343049.1 class E sortase [Corynebacterium sp. 76QC2CO]